MAFESSHTPRKVPRLPQIGRVEAAVQSLFLWFCATCQARPVPCPRGVDMAGIMLALRRKGRQEEAKKLSFYRVEKFPKQALVQAGKAGARSKKVLTSRGD